MSTTPRERNVDSSLAVAAEDLLRSASPPSLINHCLRTWFFADAIAQQRKLDPDYEVLYIACLLHDLGLTDRYAGDVDFQQAGADATYAFVTQFGWDEARAQLARDAVALHLELATSDDSRPEVALVSIGAAIDVLGLRLDEVPEQTTRSILDEFPRLGFKDVIVALMKEEAERKPDSRIASHIRDFNFLDLLKAAPFEE